VEIPRHPRQKGPFRTTATVQMVANGEIVARIPVPVILEVGEDAARPDVARGARIGLVIDRRSLRIMTQGSCLFDANIGDVVSVLVVPTSRVVKAKITSRDEAQIIEGL
jgi:flagella basal body P-ring formation protein FlgA